MTGRRDVSRLAAVVFDRNAPGDAAVAGFLKRIAGSGARIAGLVQEHAEREGCALHDAQVRDLATGERLPILQDLGAGATGCRVDPAAIALAARMLDRARETAPDLLVANRFGRLESEGGGMLVEIGQAFGDGLAVLICVPSRYIASWNAFADGLDVQLPPSAEAIAQWWESVVASLRSEAAA